MKILVDRDNKQILGASFLGLEGDEVIHCVLDIMYAKAPYTVIQRAMHIQLTTMLSKGKRAARKLKRAQILLAADAGSSDEEIARAVAVGGSTVYRTKRRFVEGNLEQALSEDPRPGAERKLTGKEEA